MLPRRGLCSPDLTSALLEKPPAKCLQRLDLSSHKLPEPRLGVPNVIFDSIIERLVMTNVNVKAGEVGFVVRGLIIGRLATNLFSLDMGIWA